MTASTGIWSDAVSESGRFETFGIDGIQCADPDSRAIANSLEYGVGWLILRLGQAIPSSR